MKLKTLGSIPFAFLLGASNALCLLTSSCSNDPKSSFEDVDATPIKPSADAGTPADAFVEPIAMLSPDCLEPTGSSLLEGLSSRERLGMVLDREGNVFIAGEQFNSSVTPEGAVRLNGEVLVTAAAQSAAVVVSLDPKGAPRWTAQIDKSPGVWSTTSRLLLDQSRRRLWMIGGSTSGIGPSIAPATIDAHISDGQGGEIDPITLPGGDNYIVVLDLDTGVGLGTFAVPWGAIVEDAVLDPQSGELISTSLNIAARGSGWICSRTDGSPGAMGSSSVARLRLTANGLECQHQHHLGSPQLVLSLRGRQDRLGIDGAGSLYFFTEGTADDLTIGGYSAGPADASWRLVAMNSDFEVRWVESIMEETRPQALSVGKEQVLVSGTSIEGVTYSVFDAEGSRLSNVRGNSASKSGSSASLVDEFGQVVVGTYADSVDLGVGAVLQKSSESISDLGTNPTPSRLGVDLFVVLDTGNQRCAWASPDLVGMPFGRDVKIDETNGELVLGGMISGDYNVLGEPMSLLGNGSGFFVQRFANPWGLEPQ